MNIRLSWDLNVNVWLGWDLDINIRFSWNLNINIWLGGNLNMDIRLSEWICTGIGNRWIVRTSIETGDRSNGSTNWLGSIANSCSYWGTRYSKRTSSISIISSISSITG